MATDSVSDAVADQLALTSIITATHNALQVMQTASQATSLAYLTAVQQFNSTATLELSTLASACERLLGPGGIEEVVDKTKIKCNCNRLPPGYPVVT